MLKVEFFVELKQVAGQVLREMRKEKGLSQEELGFECGFHRTYISLIERGENNPSIKAIFQIATSLGVKPSDIISKIETRWAQR
jgi:transcriptional regulator with XRE-family HTH domain